MKYPFNVITPLFIAGIVLQNYITIPLLIIPVFFLILAVLWFIFSRNKPFIPSNQSLAIVLSFYIMIILSGYFVSQVNRNASSYYPEWFIKQKDVTVYGRVSSLSLLSKGGFNFQLDTDSITFNASTWHKKALLISRIKENSFTLYKNISPGDYLEIKGMFFKGKEIRNPGDFDYNNYLKIQGISGIVNIYNSRDVKFIAKSGNSINSLLLKIKQSIFTNLVQLHDAKTAALLKGLLLADRSDIDEDIKTDFINSGVVHVLAVSGLHVAFILLVFLFLFGRFNLWIRSILISIGIIFYVLLTGAPASVVRSGIMSLVIIIAFVSNRDTGLLNGLAVSAFIILLFDPQQLYMAGFQLSYTAVLSIALIYPVISKTEFITSIKNNFIRKTIYFVILSFSSQLGTVPLVILYFGKISLSSLAANMLVIPLSGIILGNGIFTVILSYISYPIAHYSALSSEVMVRVLYLITEHSGGELSFISVNHFNWFNLIAFYIFIGLFIFYFPRFTSFKIRTTLLLLLMINVYIYSRIGREQLLKDNILSVVSLDVGQGDSFLIKFPNGATALIDAGEAVNNYDNGLRTVLPVMNYLNITKIDYAFISHLDKDHFSGMLSLMNSGVIKQVYKPTGLQDDSINIRLESFLRKRNIRFTNYNNQVLTIGNSKVYILNDNAFISDNDNSGLIKIKYGNRSFLFTGDISKNAENYYSDEYGSFLRSTVLKVSHHGSKTGSSERFIEYVHAKFSIISAGYKNRYNHPAPETIGNLQNSKTKVLRTDLSGAIILSTDGERIDLVKWKN